MNGRALGAARNRRDERALDRSVESRSFPQCDRHRQFGEIASERPGRLRTRPSDPSMLIGSPSTNPMALRSAARANKRAASIENVLRATVPRRRQCGGPDRWPQRRSSGAEIQPDQARRAPPSAVRLRPREDEATMAGV